MTTILILVYLMVGVVYAVFDTLVSVFLYEIFNKIYLKSFFGAKYDNIFCNLKGLCFIGNDFVEKSIGVVVKTFAYPFVVAYVFFKFLYIVFFEIFINLLTEEFNKFVDVGVSFVMEQIKKYTKED